MGIDLVSALAAKALDGLYVRQAATAQNIANAGAENYVPVRVSFETELRQAWASARIDSFANGAATLARVTPRAQEDIAIGVGTVRLDQEIATASETTARYALLTGMLDRSLQLDNLAIKGG